MYDVKQAAREAAQRLMDERDSAAVYEAAREAVTREERHHDAQGLPIYQECVAAFWKARVRHGIPAVRDVLWSMNIPADEI